MSSEKIKILEMIEQGKIKASEGLALLNALQEEEDGLKKSTVTTRANRFLRVRVNGDGSGVKKVEANIPLGLVKIATKFMNMIPYEARSRIEESGIDLSQINFDELIELVDKGLSDGKLVDVDVDDSKEGRIRVEVYVD